MGFFGNLMRNLIVLAVAEVICFLALFGLSALASFIEEKMKADVEKWNRTGGGKFLALMVVSFLSVIFGYLRIFFPVCFIIFSFGVKAGSIASVITAVLIVFAAFRSVHTVEMESIAVYGKRIGGIIGSHIVTQIISNFIFLFAFTMVQTSFDLADSVFGVITLIADGVVLIFNIVLCIIAIKNGEQEQ